MALRRGTFQIHLITAIVVMFAAGGVIELNLAFGRQVPIVSGYTQADNVFDPVMEKVRVAGWPVAATDLEIKYTRANTESGKINLPVQIRKIVWSKMWINIVVGFSILAVVAVICELILRRIRRQA